MYNKKIPLSRVTSCPSPVHQSAPKTDMDFLNMNRESWDDLNKLKNELAMTTLNFVMEIENLSNSAAIIDALGERRDEFNRQMNVFYSDIDAFTATIQRLRSEHENRTGAITSMEDLNTFTRLSMGYQTLQIEMQSLLSPTMASIVLIVHEVAPFVMGAPPAPPLPYTDHTAPQELQSE